MPKKPWIIFIAVLAALVVGGTAVGALIAGQGFGGVGDIVQFIAWALADLWLFFGLWKWRNRRWVRFTAWGLIATHALALLCVGLYFTGNLRTAVATAGIWGIGSAFLAGVFLLRKVLSIGHPVCGVARTLVDEAIRMKIVVIFVSIICILLPVMPVLLNPNELLEYRLRTFLTWSISATSMLLSIMTVLLACYTITREVSGRQIFLTLSKPVSRGQYLLGKWLGIVLLDAWLIVVAGAGIYGFARLLEAQPTREEMTYLAQGRRPALGADRVAVATQVMVARVPLSPVPPESMNFSKAFEERRKQLMTEDPATYGTADKPKPLTEAQSSQIRNLLIARWHAIPPMGTQEYIFKGLENARRLGPTVQLRFKPKMDQPPPNDMLNLVFFVNDRPMSLTPDGYAQQVSVANNHHSVMNLPTDAIRDDGSISIRIANATPVEPGKQGMSITFTPGDGLEMLYQADTFGPNLARALALVWFQLAFLAAVGLLAGSFLGFHVSVLAAALVMFAMATSGFLADSLKNYSSRPPDSADAFQYLMWYPRVMIESLAKGEIWQAVKIIITVIGQGVVALTPSTDSIDPASRIAEGLLVPWRAVGRTAYQVGLIWTGVSGAIAWWLFRRRELAAATA